MYFLSNISYCTTTPTNKMFKFMYLDLKSMLLEVLLMYYVSLNCISLHTIKVQPISDCLIFFTFKAN